MSGWTAEPRVLGSVLESAFVKVRGPGLCSLTLGGRQLTPVSIHSSPTALGTESGHDFLAAGILQLPIGWEEGQGGISTR